MYFVILAFLAVASSLVWYLLKHDHGRKLPVETLWYACGFGVLAMVLAMASESRILPGHFAENPAAFPLVSQLKFFLSIGFIEEAVKFLPLALFIYKRDYFREHTDGCIYFAICGLTFGLGENILYTTSFGAQVGVSRLILTPFFHAATTSILGYYLINYKLQPRTRGLMILSGVLVPVIHGAYDFGLGAGVAQLQVISMMLTLLLTMGLFLYFMQANTLDRAVLASAPVGYQLSAQITQETDRFCTSCGQANTYRRNYCEYCGRKL